MLKELVGLKGGDNLVMAACYCQTQTAEAQT